MIRRQGEKLLFAALMSLPLVVFSAPAQAQDEPEIDMTAESEFEKLAEDIGTAGDPESTEIDMTAEEPAATTTKDDKDLKLTETRGSWQDIVVVVRKPFLKMNRLELMPGAGVTLNDNMIRHYALNGQVNYYLTDVLAVGLEGQYFSKDFLETYDLVARQQRRLPTVNKYNWGAALNFHYVPIYAKFSMLNKHLIFLEAMLTAGIGISQSEIIPRDPAFPAWTNNNITPNVGLTFRVFLADWVTLNLSFKDYIFSDKFEDVNRSGDLMCARSVSCSQDQADPQFINHVMFSAALSFWFPTSFRYTTFR